MSTICSKLRVVARVAATHGDRFSARSASLALRVADLDRSIVFYCDGLGLELRYRVGQLWAEVQTDGLTIGLLVDARVGAQPGGDASTPAIALEVDDLVEARSRLRRQGVTLPDAVRGDGLVRVATFTDPDGHPLFLCEVLWGPGVHAVAGWAD